MGVHARVCVLVCVMCACVGIGVWGCVSLYGSVGSLNGALIMSDGLGPLCHLENA